MTYLCKNFTRTTNYSWLGTICSCTTVRQVSWLIDHRIHHLPGFPVISRLRSLNTVTSSYRIRTCFPFHQTQIKEQSCLTPAVTYSTAYYHSTLFLIVQEVCFSFYITMINVPAVISTAPTNDFAVNFSWRNTKARTKVITTLSLSIGTTLDASPICNAL